jgi:hypothetical protein
MFDNPQNKKDDMLGYGDTEKIRQRQIDGDGERTDKDALEE